MPIDRVFSHDEVWLNREQCILEMVKRMRLAKEIYEAQVKELVDENKPKNEAIVNKKTFDLGQKVLLYKSRAKLGHSKKLTKTWTGPWIVIKCFDNQINYQVKLLSDGKRKQTAHAGNMKAYYAPDMTSLSWSNNPPEEYVDEPMYVVESIRDQRINSDGDTEYYIKWTDYGEECNTWEPIESLSESLHLIQQFNNRNQLNLANDDQADGQAESSRVETQDNHESVIADHQIAATSEPLPSQVNTSSSSLPIVIEAQAAPSDETVPPTAVVSRPSRQEVMKSISVRRTGRTPIYYKN